MSILFLTVAWAIVLAFIATLIVTLLGVTNVIKFSNKKYLDKLFVAVILEVVAVGFLIFKTGFSDVSQYFQSVENIYQKAARLKSEKKYDEALSSYNEIIFLSNKSLPFKMEDVFLAKGDIAFDRGIWPQAVEAYSFYLELNKSNVMVMQKMGQALRKTYDYERAKKIYELGFSLEPQNYEILNGLQNCLRRLGAFMDEGEKKDAANSYYEEARRHILSMLSISKGQDDKRYKNASLALAKLSWQRQQYRESIAKYEEIQNEFPSFITPKEELAAVKLEYGSQSGNEAMINESVSLYKDLYLNSSEADKIFNGAGLAEAVSKLKNPTQDDLKIADNAVSLSIVNNQNVKDDPYPLYATALILKKQGKESEAFTYIKYAIHAEAKRSENPYTFDYVRLREYEKLLAQWEQDKVKKKDANISSKV